MDEGYSICLNKWALDKSIKSELGLLLIISSLCAEKGYCYASNQYFAELFGISEVAVSQRIKKLEAKNYIEITYKKKGCEVISREIRLKLTLTDDLRKLKPTIKENLKENNTSNNNINIKKRNIKEKMASPSLEEIKEYVSENNLDVEPDFFFNYFEVGNWIDSKGNKVKNWKQKLWTWHKNNQKKQATASKEKDILREMMEELENNE